MPSPKTFAPLALAALTTLLLTSPARATEYDLLIRNAKIIDGTGTPWYYADLAVTGQKIAAIGNLSNDTAKKEIDARKKLVLTPGFIDVHTHVDDDIFAHPLAENFIRDGVTTIISGNCGSSVRNVKAFFERIDKNPSAVNHATLYGHNTVLRILKGESVKGDLTPEQLEKGKALVKEAMEGGAIGFSTGLIYTPGTWSSTDEIIELAKPAGALGGIYATHMRSEGTNILKSIEEALRIGREGNMRVQISHFKLPTVAATKLKEKAGIETGAGSDISLAKVEEARIAGQEVWLDQYPYTASSTTLSTMLPDRVLEKGPAEAKKLLSDPNELPGILSEMRETHEIQNRRKDLAYAVIASAKDRPELNGKSIKQITQIRKLGKNKDADLLNTPMPEVTMEEQYKTVIDIYLSGGASCIYHSMNETEVANIMKSPLVGIASDSGVRSPGTGMPHPRGYGTNARVLGRYVRDLKVIPLEEAIRKMTSMPATAFRLKNRGLLKEGFYADLNLFDPDTITDKSTFESPHQYSEGFAHTFVNGTEVFNGTQMTTAKPGHPLKGPATVTP